MSSAVPLARRRVPCYGNRMKEQRAWGTRETLAEAVDHRVDRVTVQPGERLSLQRHRQRSEHWHMIAGRALVSVDGQEVELGPGDSVNIHCGATHRVHNIGDHPVVLIEVQRGDSFGEDDLERLADD